MVVKVNVIAHKGEQTRLKPSNQVFVLDLDFVHYLLLYIVIDPHIVDFFAHGGSGPHQEKDFSSLMIHCHLLDIFVLVVVSKHSPELKIAAVYPYSLDLLNFFVIFLSEVQEVKAAIVQLNELGRVTMGQFFERPFLATLVLT